MGLIRTLPVVVGEATLVLTLHANKRLEARVLTGIGQCRESGERLGCEATKRWGALQGHLPQKRDASW